MIALAVIYFGIAAICLGLVMCQAQIVKELGPSKLMTVFASATPNGPRKNASASTTRHSGRSDADCRNP